MRILQIIDSLEIGGAERMAVNYANILSEKIEFSGLVATRKEGNLKQQLSENVHYQFLNKKHKIDFRAVYKLFKYCKNNKVNIIQAHSSSFFIACLVKIFDPKIKIIWHDHNGGIVPKRQGAVYLQIFSVFFNGVISVNQELKIWALKKLNCKKVIYLSNFTILAKDEKKETQLFGNEGKRILCLANLRIQKNHLMLVRVAKNLKISHPDWTFHFVGKDFKDDYSKDLNQEIIRNNLTENIFLYDSRQDIEHIIDQSTIAVFSSISEGLPVSLLEYGMQKKPVISTMVGEIQLIIKDNISGFLVPINDVDSFYRKLIVLIDDKNLQNKMGSELFKTISENHAQEAVISKYINLVKNI